MIINKPINYYLQHCTSIRNLIKQMLIYNFTNFNNNNSSSNQFSEPKVQKAYHKLFQTHIDQSIRYISPNMVKFFKAAKITKIMINNHKINSGFVI